MAAVIIPTTTSGQPSRLPARDRRPALRVIDGGRSSANRSSAERAMQRVYRRRRLAASAGLVLVVLVLSLAIVGANALIQGGSAGHSSSAATAAASPAAAEAYVVQPGDTLWTIARGLDSDGDVRPLVDALADRAGGPVLQPGQRIDLHGVVR